MGSALFLRGGGSRNEAGRVFWWVLWVPKAAGTTGILFINFDLTDILVC